MESGGVRIQLDDLTISGIPQEVNAVTEHVCPDDHKRAEEILALVAGKELERLGTIDLPADDTALAMVFLAFPAQVAEGSFSRTWNHRGYQA